MHKKTLIPYLMLDYNKFVEDFQLEKIRLMEKEEFLDHLKNPESWIYDLYLKQKCINLFIATGGFITNGLTYDDLYKLGVDTTITQINKRYFFDVNNHTNIEIINKVNSRLKNNMINYFSRARKVNYFQYLNFIHLKEDTYDHFEKIILEVDLKKVERENLQDALKKVWEDSLVDMDFDLQDFEELCTKYGFTPLDILIYDPYMLPSMSKEACNNGNYQPVLVFEEEIA
ncbi:hypothetical protein [Aliarcobacter butzleri]|uniref:hypothetical protein n=1 Tax=Aliarcobacter butzleri TaxID=28197 RepID=UPI0021B656F1|nr:hypothetical protein [Aliarcobacter butzleri]MCT7642633.1 hypothetical protein [Aliarcobacter butzleri]